MRMLHTSDWHLGRSFGAFSLLDDQRVALERMAELVRSEGVELVVVSGDIFDRAIPPSDAVTTLRDGLRALRATGAQVALIAGNHDSAERLAAFDGLLADGVFVNGGYGSAGRVETVRCRDGDVAVVMLPFLDPMLAPDDLGDDGDGDADGDGDGDVVGDGDGCDEHDGLERDVARATTRRRATHSSVVRGRLLKARALVAGRRSVLMAHAFVRGGWPCGSERELSVGGTDMISADAFSGFSYVALGHLHRAQDVGSSGSIRYSGTPLAFSFGETTDKTVTLVDLAPDGEATLRPVELGVCRGVATIRGTLDDLLSNPAHAHAVDCWVRVQLDDTTVLTEPMARLRQRFPYVVEMQRPVTGSPSGGGPDVTSAQPRSPLELVTEFWNTVHGERPSSPVLARLNDALTKAVAA